jgi:transcription termination factor Rho
MKEERTAQADGGARGEGEPRQSGGGTTSSENGGSAGAPEQTGAAATARDGAENPAPARGGQGQGRGYSSGGGQGDWQERKFWKHNKRKRGRFGNWQPGQGGGPQHPQHPPQPAPPSAAVVYGDLPNPARFADQAALDALAAEISSGSDAPLNLDQIYALNLAALTEFGREKGASVEGAPNRKQLLSLLFAKAAAARQPILDHGYVDITDRGVFVVHEHVNYRLYPENAYLPDSLIRRWPQGDRPSPGSRGQRTVPRGRPD